MSIPSIVAVAVLALWVLASMKTSRPDGTLIKTHPFRRLMFYIMRTRNESVVYFDEWIPADALLAYLEKAKQRFEVDFTHITVAAANIGLAENPRMNRFVVGRRLYARTGRWLTFSMKRKKLEKKAQLSAVKLEMLDGETLKGFCERANAKINVERSGQKTHADKEFDLFNLLPRPVLRGAASLLNTLDYFNLLPGFFIRDDGMYTSIFVANLGSLGMNPGYHHLYEWGTCPLFIMVGKIHERAVAVNGQVIAQKGFFVRFTFDERIDDGLNARHGIDTFVRVMNDPQKYFGCVKEDGSDAIAMWPRPAAVVEDALVV